MALTDIQVKSAKPKEKDYKLADEAPFIGMHGKNTPYVKRSSLVM